MNTSLPRLLEVEVDSLRATVAQLESRIQKHVEFRERLIRTLGIRVASMTDADILARVETLARPASTPSAPISHLSTARCVPPHMLHPTHLSPHHTARAGLRAVPSADCAALLSFLLVA